MVWKKREGIMLCQPLDEHNLDRNFALAPKMLVQPKLDGQRAWVYWADPDTPMLISSQGNVITGVPHINLAIREMAKLTTQISFDGELYVHKMGFEEIVSRTKRLPDNLHPDYLSMEYHIFDYKGMEEVESARQSNLDIIFKYWAAKGDDIYKPFLKRVETKLSDRENIEGWLNTWVLDGYEGIIVRNPKAFYVEKRPFTILKWKPSKSDYYQIIQAVEAVSEDGHKKGELGALICADRYGNTFSVGCGVGIKEYRKRELWVLRDELVGKFAYVQYQNLTRAGIPRFGKFTLIVEPSDTNQERELW